MAPFSLNEIRDRLKTLNITKALDELQAMADAGTAVVELPPITVEMVLRAEALLAASEDKDPLTILTRVLAEVTAGGYSDGGAEGYCPQHENAMRSLMELTAFYDESGPRSDPNGEYLCGTCQLRKEPGGCLFVGGEISMETGSCQIYVIGTALPAAFGLKEKFTQEEVGYAERPEVKAFGCARCTYVAEAVAPDADGRKKWCREWGVHVRKNACCARHDGNDLIMPWQAQSSEAE